MRPVTAYRISPHPVSVDPVSARPPGVDRPGAREGRRQRRDVIAPVMAGPWGGGVAEPAAVLVVGRCGERVVVSGAERLDVLSRGHVPMRNPSSDNAPVTLGICG